MSETKPTLDELFADGRAIDEAFRALQAELARLEPTLNTLAHEARHMTNLTDG